MSTDRKNKQTDWIKVYINRQTVKNKAGRQKEEKQIEEKHVDTLKKGELIHIPT